MSHAAWWGHICEVFNYRTCIKLTVVTERRIWRAKLVTQRTGCIACVILGDHLEMLHKKKKKNLTSSLTVDWVFYLLNQGCKHNLPSRRGRCSPMVTWAWAGSLLGKSHSCAVNELCLKDSARCELLALPQSCSTASGAGVWLAADFLCQNSQRSTSRALAQHFVFPFWLMPVSS